MFLIRCKWKLLRYLANKRKKSFHRMLVRMHHIQELGTLGKYDGNKLNGLSYGMARKMFIKEFPEKYLHNI